MQSLLLVRAESQVQLSGLVTKEHTHTHTQRVASTVGELLHAVGSVTTNKELN